MVVRPKPVQVDRGCLLEEGRQLGQRGAFAELGHLAGIEVQVGQLDGDMLQRVGMRVDEAVELGLGPMQRVGHPVPAALHGLDLLQQHFLRADEQTVNPALNAQDEISASRSRGKAAPPSDSRPGGNAGAAGGRVCPPGRGSALRNRARRPGRPAAGRTRPTRAPGPRRLVWRPTPPAEFRGVDRTRQ